MQAGSRSITLETPEAQARVVLQGAHVTHWQPRGARPVLFVSPRSVEAPGRAIRGGVPICFPWFAARADDPAAPAHGFARIRDWHLVQRTDRTAVFGLDSDADTRRLWPHDFRLRFRVVVGATLDLTLETTNTSTAPFTVEMALHTYVHVSDVAAVTITGLEGATYIDKVDGRARKHAGAAPLRFDGEVDRVFVETSATCVVDDPGLRRRIAVAKTGSATTVIWNPGPARAAALADLGPDAWRMMVCVETANADDDRLTLGPGGVHRMSTTLSCG
jgi:glucose-6-phosphate 1-epimerase